MRIMITGAKGMLGRYLVQTFTGHDLIPVDIDDFDLADAVAVERAVAAAKPETTIHCAAMVAADKAEAESDAAFRANTVGSINIAGACNRHGSRLIAISTDYVFAGDLYRPYHEWDATAPRTVYGMSKLAGENGIRSHCPNHLICRVAWLYGPGGPSFVHAMLNMGSQEGPPMKVVDDQIGNPTSVPAVAKHLRMLADLPILGTMHLTCSGEVTWYGFAQEIFALWGLKRELVPCTTPEFPRAAPRPANSRLDKRMLRLSGLPETPHWRDALREFHAAYPNG